MTSSEYFSYSFPLSAGCCPEGWVVLQDKGRKAMAAKVMLACSSELLG